MNILFVCTGNTCRSPMAEAVAKSIFPKDGFEIKSAGINVVEIGGASENAIKAMSKSGLDLSDHKPSQITTELIKWADIVFTMTNGHKQAVASICAELNVPVFTIAEYGGHNDDIIDPYGGSEEIYEQCLEHLKKYISDAANVLMK
ncbi:MAG: low molecular weight protein arginine phosphatase [Firmicutes bacterium]|nr:low molecular weight protein arginine phosphatase [Bacillota bacterium]